MSGGSYNYLCHKGASELVSNEDDLQAMSDRLAAMGYADAAKETLEVLLEIRRAKNRIDTRINRLSELWHAVEWFDSCDYSIDAVKSAISKFRGEP